MAEAPSNTRGKDIPDCTSYLISSISLHKLLLDDQTVTSDRRTDRMMYINPSLLKDSSCAFITLHIIRIPNVKKRSVPWFNGLLLLLWYLSSGCDLQISHANRMKEVELSNCRNSNWQKKSWISNFTPCQSQWASTCALNWWEGDFFLKTRDVQKVETRITHARREFRVL